MNFQRLFFKQIFNLKGKKDIFSFNSIISIIGIIIGVIALTVSLALFSGYRNVVQEIILGVNSHIYITKYQNETISQYEFNKIKRILDSNKLINSYAPYVYTECMAIKKDKLAGVILRGIDYRSEVKTTKIDNYIVEGEFIDSGNNVVVGENIAKRLHVTINDTISLISPLNANITIAGIIPQKKNYIVSGIFSSGMFQFDNSLVLINIPEIRNFLDLNKEFSGISIKLLNEKIGRTEECSNQLLDKLDFPFHVTNWISMNRNLFNMLELEKWVIFIILGLIILVAGFGMTSVLTMNIFDKKREIGILKSLGTTDKKIQRLFFYRNVFVGFIAIFLGIITGILITKFITFAGFVNIESDVYMIDKLILENEPMDFFYIIITSGLIILFCSYLPLKRIKRMNVISIIRSLKK